MPVKIQPNKLRKVLGLAFGVSVVIGGTIGVGILRTPGSIAALLPHAGIILLCWAAVGVYILLAAGCYAELTTMLPKAGGAYNYSQRAFGAYAGFVTGWFDFLSNLIAPAYFCIVLSEYTALLWPAAKPLGAGVAIFYLTLFTGINLPGTKSGSAVQQVTSAAKVVLFLVLIAACFFSGGKTGAALPVKPVAEGLGLMAVMKAVQLIFGTYDGWMAVSFFAEEDKNPSRNVPKSYLLGALAIAVLYLLINAAVLYVLPVSALAQSPLAAADAAAVALGERGTGFILIVSLFSLFSILNAYMMIPSRILYGLSRDGFFFRPFATVNRGGTPYVSLLFCYAAGLVLILVSSFDQLFALGAFLITVVTGSAFASLLYLRKKEPGLPRPYKAWGHPYSTWLALAVTAALFAGFATSDGTNLAIVLTVIVLSYPAYRFLAGRKRVG